MRRVPCSGLVGSKRWVTTDDMRVPARSEVRAGPRRTGKDTDVTETGSNRPMRSDLGRYESVRASRALVGRRGRVVRRGARAIPRRRPPRRRARLGPRGLDRGRAGPARSAHRTPGARGRCRRRAGVALARGAGRRAGRARPQPRHAAARRRGRSPAVAARPGRRRRAPVRATRSFDLACSAYGAIPFVADVEAVFAEVARVLRPGGRWVFSVTHPVRWAFPDAPGPEGLVADRPYFDRTPYVERDDVGRGHLRRAPPDPRRHRPGTRGGGAAGRRPRRAGVAGAQRGDLGRLVADPRCGSCPARRSGSPSAARRRLPGRATARRRTGRGGRS